MLLSIFNLDREVLGHLIALTDLDAIAPGWSLVSRYGCNIEQVTLLVVSLLPGVKMGTWHMRRAGNVNVKH